MPLLSVRTRTMRRLGAKCPLAPFAGAAKVTVVPVTGLPFLSVTVTASGIGKRSPMVVGWPSAAPAVVPGGGAAGVRRVGLAGVVGPANGAVGGEGAPARGGGRWRGRGG